MTAFTRASRSSLKVVTNSAFVLGRGKPHFARARPPLRLVGTAHPALRCENYDVLLQRLAQHNVMVMPDPVPFEGRPHCYISDPFGNRIELIG